MSVQALFCIAHPDDYGYCTKPAREKSGKFKIHAAHKENGKYWIDIYHDNYGKELLRDSIVNELNYCAAVEKKEEERKRFDESAQQLRKHLTSATQNILNRKYVFSLARFYDEDRWLDKWLFCGAFRVHGKPSRQGYRYDISSDSLYPSRDGRVVIQWLRAPKNYRRDYCLNKHIRNMHVITTKYQDPC